MAGAKLTAEELEGPWWFAAIAVKNKRDMQPLLFKEDCNDPVTKALVILMNLGNSMSISMMLQPARFSLTDHIGVLVEDRNFRFASNHLDIRLKRGVYENTAFIDIECTSRASPSPHWLRGVLYKCDSLIGRDKHPISDWDNFDPVSFARNYPWNQ